MKRPNPAVVLASEHEFALGDVKVRPALRQCDVGGKASILEPRVMQVLVSLARRRDEVVSRDDLVEACWEGLTVGEDAIQRAIAGVRDLGRSSGAFAVQTVRKVGYMLSVSPSLPGSPAWASDEVLKHPALAIARFANRTGLVSGESLVESLSEDLCAEMAAELHEYYINVLTPHSVAALKQPERDPCEIRRALAVDYLIEGDVRSSASDYRITLRLIDTTTGALIWRQSFDGNPNRLHEAQTGLVNEIARQACAQIERIEIGRALRRPIQANAWDAQRRALAYTSRNTLEACISATAEARRAFALAPDEANSNAFLAVMLARELVFGGAQNQTLDLEIVKAVRRARELDPDNSGVLAGIASALADTGRLTDALAFAERAHALNEDSASGSLILASILARLNRSTEALAQLDRMERLAPNSIWLYRALIWRSTSCLRSGQLDAALAAAERAFLLGPNVEALGQFLVCLGVQGKRERARDTLIRSRELDPAITKEVVINTARQFNYGYSNLEDCVLWVAELWGMD